MRHFLILLIFVLPCVLSAQATEKVMYHAIHAKDVKYLQIELPPSQVEIRETDGTRLGIEVSISGMNIDPKVLDLIVLVGDAEIRPLISREAERIVLKQHPSTYSFFYRGEKVPFKVVYRIIVPKKIRIEGLLGQKGG